MADINQGGPGGFAPGADNKSHPFTNTKPPIKDHYANIDQLIANLQAITTATTKLATVLEANLATYALSVTQDDTDADLREAISQTWPSNLGDPKSYVSYYYYKYLGNLKSRAATFIRSKFEEAARDVTGTNAIDILPILQIIQDEVLLIQGFVTNYVDQIDDPAEHRAVEHLQDWTQSAFFHAGSLGSLFQKTDAQRSLPDTDVKMLTAADAHRAQALFKVNVNRINKDLVYLLDFVRKEFAEYGNAFYNNVLGPALLFRLNVSKRALQPIPGLIGQEITAARDSVDKNLRMLFADQIRRNIVFEEKVNEMEGLIAQRDQYRSYIRQLSQLGQTISTGGSGTFSSPTLDPAEIAFFGQQVMAASYSATPNFRASHSKLDDTTDPIAHPQYVLKSGDTLSGNLELADDVLVDGMRPAKHGHTGHDGTVQIHGSDIIGGSLGPGTVDTSQGPVPPFNLTVQNQSVRVIPPGVVVVDVTIAWDSPDGNTWEVQFAPVSP